jgi:prepilin-type N-terminal cleavage/methylation domain-containing protein
MTSQRRRPLTAAHSRAQSDVGFSLLEVMLTIVIIGLMTSMAVVQIGTARQAINGDSNMRVVLAQLNLARELSISQRRTIRLDFVAPNTLRIVRNEIPAGTTMLSSAVFEGPVEYLLLAGLPDTPDAFGRAQAVDFGAAVTILFNSDGTLIDQQGRPINGTVFLAVRGGTDRSARAITVLGATGRVRAYRWTGAEWIRA